MLYEIDPIIPKESKIAAPFIRYTRPTGFDFAHYGQQWIFSDDNSRNETYIQTSEDENNPKWERIGGLLEVAFEDLFKNADFINECLRMYKYKSESPLIKITEIIKTHQT